MNENIVEGKFRVDNFLLVELGPEIPSLPFVVVEALEYFHVNGNQLAFFYFLQLLSMLKLRMIDQILHLLCEQHLEFLEVF